MYLRLVNGSQKGNKRLLIILEAISEFAHLEKCTSSHNFFIENLMVIFCGVS